MLYIYTISEHVIHRVYTESIDIHSPCLIDVINRELVARSAAQVPGTGLFKLGDTF